MSMTTGCVTSFQSLHLSFIVQRKKEKVEEMRVTMKVCDGLGDSQARSKNYSNVLSPIGVNINHISHLFTVNKL